MRVTLREAEKFHGHLGPYLVLGILAGEAALRKLKCKQYFGLEVEVSGADKKPKSCLVDGLQLSTGATYGKRNIQRIKGKRIQILLHNTKNKKKIKLSLKQNIVTRLDTLRGHRDSEVLARELYKTDPHKVFYLI